MEDNDTLFQVSARLNNRTLSLLAQTQESFRRSITNFFKSEHFWQTRAQALAHSLIGRELVLEPGANWKKIYYALAMEQEPGAERLHTPLPRRLDPQYRVLEERYKYALSDLSAIKAVSQVYGLPDWTSKYIDVNAWRSIDDVEVLKYLLESGSILLTESPAREGLIRAAQYGNAQLVEFILSLPEMDTSLNRDRALREASQYGQTEVVRFLLQYDYNKQMLETALNVAVSGDHVETVKLLLDRLQLDREGLSQLMTNASNGHVLVVRLLVEKYGLKVDRKLLTRAINRRHLKLVEYLLTKIDPHTSANTALKLASRAGLEMFQLVLADRRIDPMLNIKEVIQASRFEQGLIAAALVRDKRFRVERLSLDDLALISSALRIQNSDYLQGQYRGREIATGVRLPPYLGDISITPGTDIRSLLLRLLILKHPSPEDITQWMIEMHRREFGEAARCTRDDELPEPGLITQFRAFLFCLLYPETELPEHLANMRLENASEEDVIGAAELIGAYFGAYRVTGELVADLTRMVLRYA